MNTHDIKKAAADIARDAMDRVGDHKTHPTAQDAAGIALLSDLVGQLADHVANLQTAVRMNGVDVPPEKRHPLQD